jgi:hypothetical protein
VPTLLIVAPSSSATIAANTLVKSEFTAPSQAAATAAENLAAWSLLSPGAFTATAELPWAASGGFIYPTGTATGDDAPISIRQSDGSIWIGENAWKDVPLDSGRTWAFNAVQMIDSGENAITAFQLLSLDNEEDFNYFSGISGQSFADPNFPTTQFTLSAFGTNSVSERYAVYLDPAEQTLPVVSYKKNNVEVHKLDHDGKQSSLRYTVIGTTNQIIFGGTNTVPSDTAAPTKWISVQVTGESVVYRLPLYQ